MDLAQGVSKSVTETEYKYNIQNTHKCFSPTIHYLFIQHLIMFLSSLLLKRIQNNLTWTSNCLANHCIHKAIKEFVAENHHVGILHFMCIYGIFFTPSRHRRWENNSFLPRHSSPH